MPTYQYACTECGHAFDQVQSFSDDSLTECPSCEGRLRKLFNAVGVVFKGSGFYRNDSRGPAPSEGSSGTDKSSDQGPDKSAGKGSDKGSDKGSKGSDKSTDRGSEKGSKSTAPATKPATTSTSG